MTEIIKTFLESIFPDSNYRLAVIILFAVIIFLALLLPRRKFRSQRANLVLGITIIALIVMVMAVAVPNRWQWIVGLLPTLMVGYQLFFLWLYHPREIDGGLTISLEEEKKLPLSEQSTPAQQTPQQVQVQSYKRAQDTVSSHFSLRTLFIRYGLPAVLLGITGIIISDILVNPGYFFSVVRVTDDPHMADNAARILRGVRLGAVGAYVYVLLELGRRTFRHDITGAIAMWCWVTLVLGPVLAATVAFLWRVDQVPDSGWWGAGVVLFFTGFAPRRVIAAIEQAAVQLLKVGTPTVVETRLIPLSKIRGISPQIEERLGEEGIIDVNSFAATEPVRLVRNTSFDMRQILTWIDEAILIVTLPRNWEAIEDEGITGAIDLAWYYDRVSDIDLEEEMPKFTSEIKNLATKAKLDPVSLIATIRRLYEDTQVQYIWALYNNFTEFSGIPGQEPDEGRQVEPKPQETARPE